MSGIAGTTSTAATRPRARLEAVTMRRAAGLAALLAGLVIAASPFVFGLAGNANGGERVTDRFRAGLSTEGLHQLQVNFDTVAAMGSEFFTRTLPDAQRASGLSRARFEAQLERRFPAIAEG